MKSQTLRDIVNVCGHQAAIALARSFGGRTVSVPTEARMEETHPIALSIGLTAGRKLAKARGGERLEIPSEVNALLEIRNDRIVLLFDEGKSIRSIGFELGLSRKWVRNILLKSGRETELQARELAARK